MPPGVREHGQRLFVGRARIAHGMRQATHGLDVLREDVESAVDDRLDVGHHALEIGRQRLDRGCGIEALDLAHARREVRGAAVGQVVAIHRRQHDVLELHQLHGARGIGRFVGIEPATRVAGIDGAEAAGARADLAHQHDRGGAGIPALADVRALRFLADRGEAVFAHGLLDRFEAATRRHRCPQPAGLAARRRHRRARRSGLDAVTDRRKPLGGLVFLAARAAALTPGTTGMPLNSLMGVHCTCSAQVRPRGSRTQPRVQRSEALRRADVEPVAVEHFPADAPVDAQRCAAVARA